MSYSTEWMNCLKKYAASLGPTPKPNYEVVHKSNPWIHVPQGYLPIKVAQFSRGNRASAPNHWSIFVPTSPQRGVGNYYEITGSFDTGYFMKHVVDSRHQKWENERGMHLVGYVAPSYLWALETHFSMVPIEQERKDWNCQSWVVEALQGLNSPEMYAVQMNHEQLARQMNTVEAAWRVGNA